MRSSVDASMHRCVDAWRCRCVVEVVLPGLCLLMPTYAYLCLLMIMRMRMRMRTRYAYVCLHNHNATTVQTYDTFIRKVFIPTDLCHSAISRMLSAQSSMLHSMLMLMLNHQCSTLHAPCSMLHAQCSMLNAQRSPLQLAGTSSIVPVGIQN